MYKEVICVTNRKLCRGDFFKQIEMVASSGVDKIVLREKDLSEREYFIVAEKVIHICQKNNTECILHSFINVAEKLNHKKIHLPLHILINNHNIIKNYEVIGTSIHNIKEAEKAEKYSTEYIIAGHIFETDCKKDLPPRGLEFLSSICKFSNIPVYAIGGINADNAYLTFEKGVFGVCLMSQFMETNNPYDIVQKIKNIKT
ncbi:thiamine phosphate synthase [Anaerovorax odorimutans]|uniref:thiamine phosphate synthase n=1 Tax=Anaerovorax odorimutans TaxID=109327 RepID=UPI000415B562|nr:thiamine phosphate synthase [Anaerovorax odorimutans]